MGSVDKGKISYPSGKSKTDVGDLFNPHVSVCGLYVCDIVQRQPSWSLTQGQKATYRLLVQMAGKTRGCCWPSFDYLASKLGRHKRQIKYDVDTLAKAGLIHRVRRGRQLSNIYQFLWHEIFEGEPEVECNGRSSEVQWTVRSEVQYISVNNTKQGSCQAWPGAELKANKGEEHEQEQEQDAGGTDSQPGFETYLDDMNRQLVAMGLEPEQPDD